MSNHETGPKSHLNEKMKLMSDEPFMEHPTGKYSTAIEAMEDTICRLRALPQWDHWITFCAQGEGSDPETMTFAEVRILSDLMETDVPLDLARITALAHVGRRVLTEAGSTRYSIAAASPPEVARILDAVFRHHLGIRPFLDEDDDYAVGAEW